MITLAVSCFCFWGSKNHSKFYMFDSVCFDQITCYRNVKYFTLAEIKFGNMYGISSQHLSKSAWKQVLWYTFSFIERVNWFCFGVSLLSGQVLHIIHYYDYDLHFSIIETCDVNWCWQVIWRHFCFLVTQKYLTSEAKMNKYFRTKKTIDLIIFLVFFFEQVKCAKKGKKTITNLEKTHSIHTVHTYLHTVWWDWA